MPAGAARRARPGLPAPVIVASGRVLFHRSGVNIVVRVVFPNAAASFATAPAPLRAADPVRRNRGQLQAALAAACNGGEVSTIGPRPSTCRTPGENGFFEHRIAGSGDLDSEGGRDATCAMHPAQAGLTTLDATYRVSHMSVAGDMQACMPRAAAPGCRRPCRTQRDTGVAAVETRALQTGLTASRRARRCHRSQVPPRAPRRCGDSSPVQGTRP